MIDVIRTVYLIQLQYCALGAQSVGLNVLIHKFSGVYNVVLRLDAMYVGCDHAANHIESDNFWHMQNHRYYIGYVSILRCRTSFMKVARPQQRSRETRCQPEMDEVCAP